MLNNDPGAQEKKDEKEKEKERLREEGRRRGRRGRSWRGRKNVRPVMDKSAFHSQRPALAQVSHPSWPRGDGEAGRLVRCIFFGCK